MKAFSLLALLCILSGCGQGGDVGSRPLDASRTSDSTGAIGESETVHDLPLRTVEQRLGTVFTPLESADALGLKIDRIDLPDFPGTFAVWGATGRDDVGNILTGVSTVWTKAARRPSARVFQFSPRTGELSLLGDVMSELDRLGMSREETLPLKDGRIAADDENATPTLCRECQMKVHSKFVTLDDGETYFVSMDEWNEREDGSQQPYWGSHVWRLGATQKWEHLKQIPEAMIAAGGVGRYLYLLGYFDHVLYQYDTLLQTWERKTVGSFRGHISRNLVVNGIGHVFVPRLSAADMDTKDDNVGVELVEFNSELDEIAATELHHYPVTGDASSHGIVGFARLAEGTTVFTTSSGRLYRIDLGESKPAQVSDVGWFHPEGQSYPASLFCLDGERYLLGVARRKSVPGFEWVLYDLAENTSRAWPMELPEAPEHGMKNILLYGSNTRDDAGHLYLAGCYQTADGARQFPLLWKVRLTNRSTMEESPQ